MTMPDEVEHLPPVDELALLRQLYADSDKLIRENYAQREHIRLLEAALEAIVDSSDYLGGGGFYKVKGDPLEVAMRLTALAREKKP